MSLLDVLSTVGNVLDTPRAFTWELARGGNPFDVLNPFNEEAVARRPTGWDVLESMGIQGQEGFDLTDLGAVGLEILGDPINLFGAWKAGKTALEAMKLKPAVKAATDNNALRELGLAERWMPEEVAEKTLVRRNLKQNPSAERLRQELQRISETQPEWTDFATGAPDQDILDWYTKDVLPPYHQHLLKPEIRNLVDLVENKGMQPAKVFHGTADAYDWPDEAAAAARAYNRAGEYSRHPPLHFTTPSEETAQFYLEEAVSKTQIPAEYADRIIKDVVTPIVEEYSAWQRALESARQAKASGAMPLETFDELIRQRAPMLRKYWAARDLSAAMHGGESIASLSQRTIDLVPGMEDQPWFPRPNTREYFVDVRNPITEDAWKELVHKHGWTENLKDRLPNAAQRALEEAKAMGYDAIVSSPIPDPMKNPWGLLPEEIAPFSHSQLYRPKIAPAYQQVPQLPSNKRLFAAMLAENVARGGRYGEYAGPTLPAEEMLPF